MTQKVSPEDVARALTEAKWRFAKTMPWCPHEYTLRKDWTSDIPFDDVVMFIREHGYKERFKRSVFTRYVVGDLKYWTMGSPLHITILINRAVIDDGISVRL